MRAGASDASERVAPWATLTTAGPGSSGPGPQLRPGEVHEHPAGPVRGLLGPPQVVDHPRPRRPRRRARS